MFYLLCRPSISFSFTNQSVSRLESKSKSVLWGTSIEHRNFPSIARKITPRGLTVEDLDQARDGSDRCSNVNVTCSLQPCGFRSRFNLASVLPDTEGQWPWHISLYKNGSYFCGAALVSDSVAITIASCLLDLK